MFVATCFWHVARYPGLPVCSPLTATLFVFRWVVVQKHAGEQKDDKKDKTKVKDSIRVPMMVCVCSVIFLVVVFWRPRR